MRISRFLLISSLGVLAACQQAPNTGAGKDAKDAGAEAVATVDGRSITRESFDFFVKVATGKSTADLSPEQKQEVLDALVRMDVAGAQAQKDGLDKDKDTANALALSKQQILERALQQKYLKDKTPSEQELRAEYETQVSQMPRNEYHARHILVQTEAYANDLLARLKKGEKFEALAAKESTDASKERGGDLGWFSPANMVKPFADAVMTLKKGETTAKPVQTPYGWHIIRLEDTREVQPPPFDQVKGQLGQVVMAKKYKSYSDELLKAAKVEKKL